MSSEKIYTTVSVYKEDLEKLRQEAMRERRSVGFIVAEILKNHYEKIEEESKKVRHE